MTTTNVPRLHVSALTVFGVLVALASIAAQAPETAANRWVPGRTPDGQPNLQGTWTNGAAGRPLERPAGETSEVKTGPQGPRYFHDGIPAIKGASQIPLIVDPANGTIPYQSWALERKNRILAPNGKKADTHPRCLPPGVPRLFFPYNYSDGHVFLQSPGQVVILSEWNHQYRNIPLDGRPHPGPDIRLWMGDSRGHWEGNTLVVDVTNFTDQTWLTSDGDFHTDALHVIERFTMVDSSTISYEAIMEDPKAYTRPWRIVIPLKRAEKGYELFEYACHEGNRSDLEAKPDAD